MKPFTPIIACLVGLALADSAVDRTPFFPLHTPDGAAVVSDEYKCRRPISTYVGAHMKPKNFGASHADGLSKKNVNCDWGGIVVTNAVAEVGTHANGDMAFRVHVDFDVPNPPMRSDDPASGDLSEAELAAAEAVATRRDLALRLLGGTFEYKFVHEDTRGTISYRGDPHPSSFGGSDVSGYDLCCGFLDGTCVPAHPDAHDGHLVLRQCAIDPDGAYLAHPDITRENVGETVSIRGGLVRSVFRTLPGRWTVLIRLSDHWGELVGEVRIPIDVPVTALTKLLKAELAEAKRRNGESDDLDGSAGGALVAQLTSHEDE